MEFRSSRRQNENEYKELKITLNGMGLYEEGMELQEMRHIIDALQQSVSETETNLLDVNMERAMRESEMDFMPFNNERVFNSTMEMGSSPCTSPDIPSQHIVVQADVHHSLDWSPAYTEEERLLRKRLATSPNREANNLLHCIHNSNEIIEPNVKRIQNCMEIKTTPQQSLSIFDPDNDSIYECHDDSISPHAIIDEINFSNHEVIGPISMRPPVNVFDLNIPPANDSGLNFPHSMSSLSSSASSSSSSAPSSLSPSSVPSSSVNHSNQNVLNSFIEILGPVSLRRPIHDSGVTSFNETANISSSSWEFHVSSRDSIDNNNSKHSLNLPPTIPPQHESDEEKSNTSVPCQMFPTVYKTATFKPLCGESDDDNNENSEPSF